MRAPLESRFGHDFGSVRIHADGSAAEAANRLGARAFAIGPDIGFGAGQFAPNTPEGRGLLEHELVHVVQGERAPPPRQLVSREDDVAEREAEALTHGSGPIRPTANPNAPTPRRVD